jgi:hypothetical protein
MTQKLKNQKDSLARLMATENLTIVHKKIPTAYFDVKNRVLACPTFKEDISPELYDLFMGHEVGHALNTPYEGLHSTLVENKTLKGYLNVVEDVRIEKAIKQKYQGLRTSFFKAYNELMEKDFFGIKDRDLNQLALIDKINLITKCGSRVNIKLNSKEQTFLDMAELCKTWEEVVTCATAIYEYSKGNEERDEEDEQIKNSMMPELDDEETEEEESKPSPMQGEETEEESEEEETDADYNQEEELEDKDAETKDDVMNTGSKAGKFEGHYDDIDGAKESITEHFAHNNEDDFVDETACIKTNIDLRTRFKQKNMSEVIYTHKEIKQDWENWFAVADVQKELDESNTQWDRERNQRYLDDAIETRANIRVLGNHYRKYIQNKNKKIVAHMAKEFELRQNAHRSAKAFTGTSGELDMTRLAKYQIVDDIFKRVTYIPDGQNHGVNVLLDWSGSIHNEVADMLEQSMILSEFCRKVNIPYRVYLFSDSIERRKQDDYYYSSGESRLVEVMSNEMSNRQYSEIFDYLACILVGYMHDELLSCWKGKGDKVIDKYNEIFGSIQTFDIDAHNWGNSKFERRCCPENYRLGGTPLDDCLVALRTILPEFNAKYQVEKSILTIITDGFSFQSDYFKESEKEREDFSAQAGDDYYWSHKRERYFVDPFTNKNFAYSTSGNRYRNEFEVTQNLLEWLSETTNVTITGYFVFTKKRDFQQMGEYIMPDFWHKQESLWKEMRKSGVVIDTKGYNKLFLTTASNLATTGDDELDTDLIGANKNRVTAAFKRNQRGKSTSRFLTNEFIQEIA